VYWGEFKKRQHTFLVRPQYRWYTFPTMLMKDHSDSLVLIVLHVVLRTVLKWE